MPYRLHRVTPTTFGNVYAMAEEYQFDRYGVDAVLFWSRLRQLMIDHVPEFSERISQQKTMLDLRLNLAFGCGLVALEIIALFPFRLMDMPVMLISSLVLSIILANGFYSASIASMHILGELIKISFDQYRHLILESFGLQKPTDLLTEREMWIDLAKFLRWGDMFYFPKQE